MRKRQVIVGHQPLFAALYLCRIQNPGLFRTLGIFKSLWNMYDDQVYSEPLHSQNSLFKHFKGYLARHIFS